MNLPIYELTSNDIQALANQAKDLLLDVLEKDGYLTLSKEHLGSMYAVVLTQKGYFGKLWDQVFHKDEKDDGMKFIILKTRI